MRDVHVYDDPQALAEGAAGRIAEVLRDALRERPRATLVLTGGSTPAETYRRLADQHREAIEWERVDVFWGDERFVPPDHEESNYRMGAETLLSGIGSGGVYPIPTTLDSPDAVADAYELTLRTYFGAEEVRFDLTLLGLGADGHVASLFPGARELEERDRLVISSTAPEGMAVRDRITLTFPVLNASRAVLFIVSGSKKQDAVGRAFAPQDAVPAGRVRPEGRLIWCLDEAAYPETSHGDTA